MPLLIPLRDNPSILRILIVKKEKPSIRCFSKLSLYSYVLLSLCLTLVASQNKAEEKLHREQIIISSERYSRYLKDSIVSTEVISRQDIESSAAANAAEALRHHLGIDMEGGLRGQVLRLQGLNPEHALILINGERVIGDLAGAIDLSRIKAEEIERIEIVKGTSSVLYGSAALSGTINIITRNTTRPYSILLDNYIGTGDKRYYRNGIARSNLTLGLSNDFLQSTVTMGWQGSGGYDLDPPSNASSTHLQKQATNGSEFSDLNFGNRNRWQIGKSYFLYTQFHYRYLEQNLVEFSPPRLLQDRRNTTHDLMINLKPSLQLPKNGNLALSYNFSYYRDSTDLDQRGSDELDSSEKQREHLHEGRLQLDYEFFREHWLRLGLEGAFEELISVRVMNGYAEKKRLALFVQDEWTVFDNILFWVLAPGLRVEYDSRSQWEVIPKLSTRLDPLPQVRLRFSVGSGYRVARLKDLYLEFLNPSVGYQVVGNEELQPEKSISYNLSLEYEPFIWLYTSFGFFRHDIRNLFDYRRIPERRDELTTYSRVNINKALVQGVEFAIGLSLARSLSLKLGYSYTEAKDLTKNVPLERRSPHRATYGLDYEYHPWSIGLSLQGSLYSKQVVYQFSDTGNQIAIPNFVGGGNFNQDQAISYHRRYPRYLLNLRIYKKFFKNYELYFGIDNLLNQYDLQLDPSRPRLFYFGLRLQFLSQKVAKR